jgi:anti-sigma factor RsiW
MTNRSASADAHAYVDNCLDADARRAFEAKLGEDSSLRRRVESLQAQNQAIRAAYGVANMSPGALGLGRPANEGASSWMPSQISSRRAAISPREPQSATASYRSVGTGGDFRARARAKTSPYARLALVFGLSVATLVFSARGGPADPREGLGELGLSAYRTFGVASAAAFDYSPDDASALAEWLSPRFWPAAPASSLEIAGWTLVGVRILPGAGSAAAFIVWENAEAKRMGLIVEPLDAPAFYAPKPREAGGFSTAAWTAGGRGFAAVAPDPKALQALTRIGEDSGAAR